MNDDDSWGAVEAKLQEVEMENGRPIVVSRYGYHIEEIGGKKYLVASTKEELDAQLKKRSKIKGAQILGKYTSAADPSCAGSGPRTCLPYNNCEKCQPEYIGDSFIRCVCVSS